MATLVRDAVPGDIPWLMEQLRAFDAFFGAHRSLFPDEDYASAQLEALIATGPFFIAERISDSEPTPRRLGFITGLLSPHYFNPSIRVLSELLWWVDEAERGGRAGALLLSHFLAFGKEHADWIVFTLETASPVNEAALTTKGFRLHERAYLYEVVH